MELDLNNVETRVRLMGHKGLTLETDPAERRALGKSKAFVNFRENATAEAQRFLKKLHRQEKAIGQQNRLLERNMKTVNGLGTLAARIPLEVMAHMRALHNRPGYECWDDPDFMEAFLRDNPQYRVTPARGTRGQEYAGANKAKGRRKINFSAANFHGLPLAT